MVFLNRLLQAVGLGRPTQKHGPLRATIHVAPAPIRRKGYAAGEKSSVELPITRGARRESAAGAVRGEVSVATAVQTDVDVDARLEPNRGGADATQLFSTTTHDTLVQMPVAPSDRLHLNGPDAPQEPLDSSGSRYAGPTGYVEPREFSLDIGSNEYDGLEGDEDYDESTELLEEGVCRQCWEERREEVHAERDPFSGLMICPTCKCTFRARG